MDVVQESDEHHELKVNFYPELFLQRRIWILNILRKESISQVCSMVFNQRQPHLAKYIKPYSKP